MQINTSGGSSETELKALTVKPWLPSRLVRVTMVTPVANLPNTSRNVSEDTDITLEDAVRKVLVHQSIIMAVESQMES